MGELEYKVDDGIGRIVLNRPERRNALTLDMVDGLADALASARGDDSVRVLVVTGAGDGFCSGIDLSVLSLRGGAFDEPPLYYRRLLTDRIQRIALAMADLDKPVIAGLAGSAVGAGLDLALMCDLRVAGASVRLAESYITVGLVPGAGGCYLLPRLVGRAKALELLLTGDFVDAEAALAMGMINQVVADDELVGAVDALARRIADAPPVAVGLIKRAALAAESMDLRSSLDMVASHMAVVISTRDGAEALSALQEERPPRFRGE